MSTNCTQTQPKYVICIGEGYISVEAPNRKDCIFLLHEAIKIKVDSPINEAIR